MSNVTHTVESLLVLIQDEGVRRAAALLRKPPLPSRLLQELSERTDVPEARQFVAAYPLSPSHLLEVLARETSDADVLVLLASNPRTPPHLLSVFAAHAEPRVRAQASQHPQIPPRELTALVDDADRGVRRALASNPSLRLPHFALLAADPEPAVRLQLVRHAALPAQAALVLGADASSVVHLQCVATARVEESVLVGWAACDEEDVQLALARREDLTKECRLLLAQSPHASVRRAVRDTVVLDDVGLLHLVTRGDIEERVWVAGRDMLARPLQNLLAQDASPEVREALARNLSLDEEIARFFIGQAEAPVCAALAVNPAVPLELVQELAATRHPEVLVALSYREWIDPELMQFLLGHSAEFRGHWALQKRPVGEWQPEVAEALLRDPRPSVQALGVAGHVGLRSPDLWDYARSPAAVVRLAAVRHSRASDDLVSDMCADPDPEVAAAAALVREKRAQAAAAAAVAASATELAARGTLRESRTAHHARATSSAHASSAHAGPDGAGGDGGACREDVAGSAGGRIGAGNVGGPSVVGRAVGAGRGAASAMAGSSFQVSSRSGAARQQASGIFDKLKRIFWQ